jgi:hypothetical protein
MSKLRSVNFLSFLIVLLAVEVADADRYTKNDFNISFPSGWIEMPRDIIDSYEKEVAKAAPDFPMQHYDYGFQLKSSRNWFEYPYILIQVKNSGRIPENEFKNFEQISLQKDIDKHRKQVGSILSDIQAGKMVFDKQNKVVWMRIEGNVANIGPITGLMCMIPTEKGFIQVYGYSLKSEYSKNESVFRSIALSTTLSADLMYKPNWTDNVPSAIRGIKWDKVIGKAIVGAIIGGVICLLSYLRRKKGS